MRRQLDVLAGHCADLDRDYHQIDRTISTILPGGEPVASTVDRFAALGELGITHIIAIARGRPLTAADLTTLGETAAQLPAA